MSVESTKLTAYIDPHDTADVDAGRFFSPTPQSLQYHWQRDLKMSLDPSTHLNSMQNSIRARPIPWDGAVRAGTITEQDLRRIKAVDKVRKEHRRQTVEANPSDFVALLLGSSNSKSVLEAASKRQELVQYLLVLTGDLLNDVPDFGAQLQGHSDPFRPFVPLLDYSKNAEDPIPLLTSSVLSTIIGEAQKKNPKSNAKTDAALSRLLKFLSELTKRSDSGLQEIAVQEYSKVLRTKRARELFWSLRKETVGPLMDIFRTTIGVDKDSDSTLWSAGSSVRTLGGGLGEGIGIQLLYHVLLVIWQLSFEASLVGDGLQSDEEIIPLYTQLLRLSPKEKTTRLLLSTLLNLLKPNRSNLLPIAVSAHLPPLLETLKGRHLTDPDLLEDLKELVEMFEEYTNSQTTFDEYASEVLAGHLRWSPPHRSPTFWTENASKILTENKSELPKKLAEILGKSWENDKQVLAIACNDVSWLVKTCPEKRDQLEKLGIKVRVMELMADTNESVRWESLRAVGEWLRYNFE